MDRSLPSPLCRGSPTGLSRFFPFTLGERQVKESIGSINVGGRREVRVGSVVRFSAGKRHGPKWDAGFGVSGLYTLPGWFVVRGIHRTRRFRDRGDWRVYLDVCGLDKTAGHFTVFVAGASYTRHGVRWRPYRVHIKPAKRQYRKGKR